MCEAAVVVLVPRQDGVCSVAVSAAVFTSGESAVLSFVTWLSGAEQSGLRGPSTENQEAKQAAILCIKVNPHTALSVAMSTHSSVPHDIKGLHQ